MKSRKYLPKSIANKKVSRLVIMQTILEELEEFDKLKKQVHNEGVAAD